MNERDSEVTAMRRARLEWNNKRYLGQYHDTMNNNSGWFWWVYYSIVVYTRKYSLACWEWRTKIIGPTGEVFTLYGRFPVG